MTTPVSGIDLDLGDSGAVSHGVQRLAFAGLGIDGCHGPSEGASPGDQAAVCPHGMAGDIGDGDGLLGKVAHHHHAIAGFELLDGGAQLRGGNLEQHLAGFARRLDDRVAGLVGDPAGKSARVQRAGVGIHQGDVDFFNRHTELFGCDLAHDAARSLADIHAADHDIYAAVGLHFNHSLAGIATTAQAGGIPDGCNTSSSFDCHIVSSQLLEDILSRSSLSWMPAFSAAACMTSIRAQLCSSACPAVVSPSCTALIKRRRQGSIPIVFSDALHLHLVSKGSLVQAKSTH